MDTGQTCKSLQKFCVDCRHIHQSIPYKCIHTENITYNYVTGEVNSQCYDINGGGRCVLWEPKENAGDLKDAIIDVVQRQRSSNNL